jgi:hypothetical protein
MEFSRRFTVSHTKGEHRRLEGLHAAGPGGIQTYTAVLTDMVSAASINAQAIHSMWWQDPQMVDIVGRTQHSGNAAGLQYQCSSVNRKAIKYFRSHKPPRQPAVRPGAHKG